MYLSSFNWKLGQNDKLPSFSTFLPANKCYTVWQSKKWKRRQLIFQNTNVCHGSESSYFSTASTSPSMKKVRARGRKQTIYCFHNPNKCFNLSKFKFCYIRQKNCCHSYFRHFLEMALHHPFLGKKTHTRDIEVFYLRF